VAGHVDDHGKKVDTKGPTAKVTLLNGSEKTEATLLALHPATTAKMHNLLLRGP
jgi:hypothetical protein